MHVEFGRVEHEDNGVCFACLAISVIRCGMHCMGAQHCMYYSSAHFRFFDASMPLNVPTVLDEVLWKLWLWRQRKGRHCRGNARVCF